MKKLLFIFCAGTMLLFVITNLIAQDYSKAMIINTSSASEVEKILSALKNTDPSAYRLTVRTRVNGKQRNFVYGTAPIESLNKINGSAANFTGNYNASDVLVMMKSLTKMTGVHDDIVSKINQKLTTHSLKTVKMAAVQQRAF